MATEDTEHFVTYSKQTIINRTSLVCNDRYMEYCTITKEYLAQRVASVTEYGQLPPIDMSYIDGTEELLYPAA